MAMTGPGWRTLATALLIVAALAWLRDPPWLAGYRHGFFPVEVDAEGVAFQWTAGRASFYVPADAAVPRSFHVAAHPQFPTQVSVSVDGRLVDRFVVGPEWRKVTVPVAQATTSRRHRRVDVHVAMAWGFHRQGVRLRFD
jgi:hypothetical protein